MEPVSIAPTPDPSPVVAPPPSAVDGLVSGQGILDAMSDNERREWRLKGTVPEAKTTPPGSAPAPPAELLDPDDDEVTPPAAVVGAAPVVAPVKAVSKRQQQINDYERRIAWQNERIARLEQAQTQPRGAPRPAPAPAPVQQKDFERYKAMPSAPKLEAYDQYEDWNIDMGIFIADRRHEERTHAEAQRGQQEAASRAFQTVSTSFIDRVTAARARHADFDAKTASFMAGMGPGSPIGDAVFTSEVGPDLALHFSEHPEDFSRIVRLHPAMQLRELGKLEAKFETPAAPAPPAQPALKTVSSAPPPPPTLGTRAADPVDAAQAALKRGDFASYRALQNAADLANKKR